MSDDRLLTFYLHRRLRDRAAGGRHNFISKICAVAESAGFEISFDLADQDRLLRSVARPGYAVFHMHDPFHDRALTIRKAYQYPFWAIERSAERWQWDIARQQFDPFAIDPQKATRFFEFWAQRQFGEAPAGARDGGYVYVPLQGRLLHQRSFQSCTPLEMLEQVLALDPGRPVVATLHPREDYAAAETAALERLAARFPRLSLSRGSMAEHLQNCSYVATQNSSAAFFGYFFRKPAVLFAKIDFHHIASNVQSLGAAEAIARAAGPPPDYAAYLFWFWQQMSINAGLETAEAKIRSRLQGFGWPV
jgi:hypothetical protein